MGAAMTAPKLMAHQKRALAFSRTRQFYALLMEQGTGKTAVGIHDAAERWLADQITGFCVLAPNGVHTNWTLREIPTHMPDGITYISAAWYSSMNRAEERAIEELFAEPADPCLRILTMNWEALLTKDGWRMAERFAKAHVHRLKLGADESQRIKNPGAQRTKKFMNLTPYSLVRAIYSGTAIVQSPWDAYSQFDFLHSSILKTPSYAAFRAEYAELITQGHGLMRHIMLRHTPQIRARFKPQLDRALLIADEMERRLEVNRIETLIHEEIVKRSPAIIAKDPVTGLPKWRNLEKLAALIAPHSFRVLKEECLDLPAKVYTQRFFRMTAKQRKDYVLLRDDFRLKLENETIIPQERIATITKLSQIVSGYFLIPGTDRIQRVMPNDVNPKLQALMDEIEDCEGKIIIWARFHVEIEDIMSLLREANIHCVAYHGGVAQRDRTLAIDSFQEGSARVFVGQQAAGGTGITLTAAQNVIYYSNTWSLEDRLQSEDRAHRIGQTKSVRYVDIIAQDSIDENVTKALRAKIDLSRTIMGDQINLATTMLGGG